MKVIFHLILSCSFLAISLSGIAQAAPTPKKSENSKTRATKKSKVVSPPPANLRENPPVPNVPTATPSHSVLAHPPMSGNHIPAGMNVTKNKNPQLGNPDPNGMAASAGQVIDGSNWDDQDIADEYTKYTGRRVLLSSATRDLEIRFFQRGPLTNAKAADLLEKVLGMEGYAFVPSGVNEVKLLPKASGHGVSAPEELSGDIIENPADVPKGDNYISYFMRLNFIKPEEAVRTFTQSINGLGAGAKISPVPNASGIIITGKANFIRKLINQKHYIDVAAGNVGTAWVQLKYGDAEEIATTLNEIVNSQQKQKTTAGVTKAAPPSRRGSRPPQPPRRGSTSSASNSSSSGEDIPVQIVASPRLNKIFIMGRPVDIVFVEGLAREFDAPPNHNNFIKRKLRFMIASDFLQVASDALSAVESAGSSKRGGNTSRSNFKNSRNRSTARNYSSSRFSGRSSGGSGRSSGVESVQEFNVSDVPESMVIGKTLIVADNLANSILVQGPPESLRIISELIDKLDGRPQQVMISTVFGDMALGKTKEVGVKWGSTSQGSGSHLGAGSINATPKNPLVGLVNLTTAAALSKSGSGGLNLYGQIDNLSTVIHALESHSDFKVLSRPTVYTANNRKAVISSGRRIAVPTNTFSSGGNIGGATQSTNIEYRDVLLRFEVVPLINSEEEVTLRISLLNEDTQGSQIIDGNEIPTIVTESISTTVTVANNSTVVLGGLVTEKIKNVTSGVPVLSRIPLLGRLFRSDSDVVDRRELLIFMQPSIISGEISQHHAQNNMKKRYKVAPALQEFADGDNVLPSKHSAKDQIPRAIPVREPKRFRYPTRR